MIRVAIAIIIITATFTIAYARPATCTTIVDQYTGLVTTTCW